MLSLSSASFAFSPAVVPSGVQTRAVAPVMETVGDLKDLAAAQKVPMGYWDPLGMVDLNLFDLGQEGTIGWLRHCEIKHGRVAMAAFVGFCVQSNGIAFPWALTGGPLAEQAGGTSTMYSDLAAIASPIDQWDAVPVAGKMQIIGTIAFLEVVGERLSQQGGAHYTKGGKPGFYPSLIAASDGGDLIPHSVPLDLYDPFGLFKNRTPEQKERGLNVEINNGRAAMLGIFGLISSAKGLIVPGIDQLNIAQAEGQPMAFFGPNDQWPLVQEMWEGYTSSQMAGL